MSKTRKKFLFGKKVGMTQVFNDSGKVVPVTVIEISSCVVLQLLEGSLKIAYQVTAPKNVNKPHMGVFTKLEVPLHRYIREIRMNADDISAFSVGQTINAVDMFSSGDKVDVIGVSKGKGFQGNIKRHGQSRGPETHGSGYHRRPGSMGANSTPARVLKGKKLPGRMGGNRVTVQNLQVVGLDGENGVLWIKGAIPGANGCFVEIVNAVKSGK